MDVEGRARKLARHALEVDRVVCTEVELLQQAGVRHALELRLVAVAGQGT